MKPYEFLKTLLNTPSPSGFETRGQKVWVDYVSRFADSVEIDSYGNAFATLNPQGDPTVLMSGHVDELGLMISHISEEGFLYFKGIGGVDKALIRGQRVTVHGAKGPVPGVTGLLAIHLQEPDDRNKVPEMHAMHIDIGVSSRKEAEKLVSIGDPITYSAEFQELAGGRFAARGCDNRIGAWTAAEGLRLASLKKGSLKAKIVAVSTIQEENGLYGASMAGYSVHPDVALVVDVTHSTDIPNCSKQKHGEVSMGQGPVISLGSVNHPGRQCPPPRGREEGGNSAPSGGQPPLDRNRCGRDLQAEGWHSHRLHRRSQPLHAFTCRDDPVFRSGADGGVTRRLCTFSEKGRTLRGEDLIFFFFLSSP